MGRMRARPTDTPETPFDPTAATQGDFRPDGSWNPYGSPGEKDPERSLYWFVDMLVTKRRRDPVCAPYQFASRIARSPWARAFPSAVDTDPKNHSRWTAEVGKSPIPFYAAAAITTAEITVKNAGHGGDTEQIMALHRREMTGRTDIQPDAEYLAKVHAALSVGG